jgi:hypothetical protein
VRVVYDAEIDSVRVAPVLKKAIQDGSIKLTAIVNTHQ